MQLKAFRGQRLFQIWKRCRETHSYLSQFIKLQVTLQFLVLPERHVVSPFTDILGISFYFLYVFIPVKNVVKHSHFDLVSLLAPILHNAENSR